MIWMIDQIQLELYIFVEVKIFLIYVLGCGKEKEIRPQDIIVCTDCSGRIFFKKRGNKSSQYEARWVFV